MEINENGIFDGTESLIEISDNFCSNPYNGNSLCARYSKNHATNRIREINGPLLVRGDILVQGDIIGENKIYSMDTNNNIDSVRIDNLYSTISNQQNKIIQLETIIQFLCEKFSVNPNNISEEYEKLKDRTEIEKRLEAI